MILQALYEYYQRKCASGDGEQLAPPGFQMKEIPFVIVLDENGGFIMLKDTRETDEKKKRAKSFLVPRETKRSGKNAWQTANLLWDKPDYVLGVTADASKQEVALKAHGAFKEKIAAMPQALRDLPSLRAVCRFLNEVPLERIQADANWLELTKATGATLTFQVGKGAPIVCEEPAVKSALAEYFSGSSSDENTQRSICLITGQQDEIERLHPAIKGVLGSQTSGANIVSFNLDAFNSYGKTQGFNAPVGKEAAFAYTTALNHLLGKDSKQKIQLGETTVVFWAEKSVPRAVELEDWLSTMLMPSYDKDDPDVGTRAVEKLYKSPFTGKMPSPEDESRFYVLGLAPNAARLAIRFWHVLPIQDLEINIKQHFDDLKIVHADWEHPYPPLIRLLQEMAVQGKRENVPPRLEGEMLEAILTGQKYPLSILHALVRRIRAEHAGEHSPVNYRRAALLKAFLNRWFRLGVEGSENTDIQQSDRKEILMTLDLENDNIGYCLGRLFAVLEKIQEDANPGINATIRDRYYGSASATPSVAFPQLLKLKNHHLAKLDSPGRVIFYERLIAEIMAHFQQGFPNHMSLFDQGTFAIGYYHQRQAFYQKKDNGSQPELVTMEA